MASFSPFTTPYLVVTAENQAGGRRLSVSSLSSNTSSEEGRVEMEGEGVRGDRKPHNCKHSRTLGNMILAAANFAQEKKRINPNKMEKIKTSDAAVAQVVAKPMVTLVTKNIEAVIERGSAVYAQSDIDECLKQIMDEMKNIVTMIFQERFKC